MLRVKGCANWKSNARICETRTLVFQSEIDNRHTDIASLEGKINREVRTHEDAVAKLEEDSAILKEQLSLQADRV